MNKYIISAENIIEISFGVFPEVSLRDKMKSVKYRWNPAKRIWWALKNDKTLAVAKDICGDNSTRNVDTPAPLPVMSRRCCYFNSVENFLQEKNKKNKWLEVMKSAFSEAYIMSLGDMQIAAWDDCFECLQEYILKAKEDIKKFDIIFEYALPYESGRRPDVLLVSKEQIFILEFKMKNDLLAADIDQAAGYARDIREYHFESRNKKISTVLVLTKASRKLLYEQYGDVVVCSANKLCDFLEKELCSSVEKCDVEAWMKSKHEPLPTIVDAARKIMKNDPLPNIKQVHSSTVIPQAIELLTNIAKEAEDKKQHMLVTVTGVPGSGKTYLGLQYVYDICASNNNANSVYLSGNGPLVLVLQDALHGKVFVKSVHSIVDAYIEGKADDFSRNIIVFDEGQRAWDKNKMNAKPGRNGNYPSEPEALIKLCSEKLEWCVFLLLVGEGQSIHEGENSGMALWNTAINKAGCEWKVVCPPKLKDVFLGKELDVKDALDLNVSLRTHTAGEASKFVNTLITGEIEEARSIAENLKEYNMYVTRDLQKAKDYCRHVYAGRENARYGGIVSSKVKKMEMEAPFSRDKRYIAKWFNSPVDAPGSCCKLETFISEFDCQGLEIDMPIIGWGVDMVWTDQGWSKFKPNESNDSEANTYRRNSYRVLLTRGRDGFIIFVPKNASLDATFDVLLKAGIKDLQTIDNIFSAD